MSNKVAIILVNYKDYAKKYLPDCIASIRSQKYSGQIKIFVTDNASTQESVLYLYKNIPEAEFLLNKSNDGFAKGNNDAIKLALAQSFDYIFCLNLDTIIDEYCVSNLVQAFVDEKIVIAQARLMLHPETNKINSLGNDTHFLGFGYCRAYNQSFIDCKNNFKKEISYPSGAAVMFKKDFLENFSLFDEHFWMYNEDQDIGLRAWCTGFKCVLVGDAVVYHKYEFSRSIKKFYWMDRNRIIVILKYYSFFTLFLIMPAFLLMELGLVSFSVKGGWFLEKLKVWMYFFNPFNWIYLIKARRETQKIKKIKDYELFYLFTGSIWYQEINDWKLKIANPVFEMYFKIVLKILKFFNK